jgi:hypothetical protein
MMEDVVYVYVPYGPAGPTLGVQLAVLMKFSDVCDVTLDVSPLKSEATWESQSRDLHSGVRQAYNRAIARQENIEEIPEPSGPESLSAMARRFKSHIPPATEALDRRIARLISEPVTYGVVRNEKIDPYQINRAIDMKLIADAPARALMFSAVNAISNRNATHEFVRLGLLATTWGILCALLGDRLDSPSLKLSGEVVASMGIYGLLGGLLRSLIRVSHANDFLNRIYARKPPRR